jgi:hypothetical protein
VRSPAASGDLTDADPNAVRFPFSEPDHSGFADGDDRSHRDGEPRIVARCRLSTPNRRHRR